MHKKEQGDYNQMDLIAYKDFQKAFANELANAAGMIYAGPGLTDPPNVDGEETGEEDVGQAGRGHIISVANGIAAAGPIGIMADIGGVVDSDSNSKLYFTIGWVQGFGAGAGLGYSTTNKGFRVRDMDGWASGWMVSAFFVTYENFGDLEHGATRDYVGTKMTSNGGSVGTPGFGAYHYFSYTITVNVPSSEMLFNMVRHWH